MCETCVDEFMVVFMASYLGNGEHVARSDCSMILQVTFLENRGHEAKKKMERHLRFDNA